jgi:hypothetical protein
VFNRGAVQLTQHMQGISAGDAVQQQRFGFWKVATNSVEK